MARGIRSKRKKENKRNLRETVMKPVFIERLKKQSINLKAESKSPSATSMSMQIEQSCSIPHKNALRKPKGLS